MRDRVVATLLKLGPLTAAEVRDVVGDLYPEDEEVERFDEALWHMLDLSMLRLNQDCTLQVVKGWER